VLAQGRSVAQQTAQMDREIESVRTDLGSDKSAIVTEAMKLDSREADKLWLVYREYEKYVDWLNIESLVLLHDYAAQYTSMTDA
jgi:hypothetical protein